MQTIPDGPPLKSNKKIQIYCKAMITKQRGNEISSGRDEILELFEKEDMG